MRKFINIIVLTIFISILASCNDKEGTNKSGKELDEKVEVQEEKVQTTEIVETIEVKQTSDTKMPFNEAEKAYFDNFSKVTDILGEDIILINEAIIEANNNPNLYLDEQWQFNFSKNFIRIGLTNDMILGEISTEGDVPGLFRKTHRLTKELFSQLMEGAYIFSEGARNNDTTKMNEGITVITSVIPSIEEISLELERINEIRY